MKKILFFYLCGISFSVCALDVQLSTNEIVQGQSVELILSDTTPLPAVDFSPLTKDFMLGGQGTSQSSHFINGVGSTTYEKTIVLLPVKEGQLKIPSLMVGAQKTPELNLTVLPPGKSITTDASDTMPEISLTADVSDTSPYVGQSIFYTLSLQNAEMLMQAEIVPSPTDSVKLTPLGSDNLRIQKGQRIVERKYILKPTQEGTLTLSPAVLNGQIVNPTHQPMKTKGLFSLFDATNFMSAFTSGVRPVQVISNPISLTVRPKPQAWTGWWLPTEQADLTLLPQIPQNITVGQTMHLTLSLVALNVDANDLPVPHLLDNKGMRYYPEPVERKTSFDTNGNLMGEIRVPYTVIPLSDGQQKIEVSPLPWFNVKTGKIETTQTEPLAFSVAPGKTHSYNPPVLPIENPPKVVSKNEGKVISNSVFWLSIIGAFVLGLVLAGGIFYLARRRKKSKQKEKPIPDFYPF